MVALFVRYFVLGTPVVAYKDDIVSCGTVRRPLDTLAVHSGPENFIRVGGRMYRGVRGLQPYYLRLPLLKSILFVTSAASDAVEFHIVKVGDWTEVKVRGEKLSFGGHIGDPDPPGSPYTDYVEKESAKELVLATRYPHAKTRVFLDLQAKTVTKVDYDEFDEAGRLKAHRVYVDGRQVE
jgi:hypothetical protein